VRGGWWGEGVGWGRWEKGRGIGRGDAGGGKGRVERSRVIWREREGGWRQ